MSTALMTRRDAGDLIHVVKLRAKVTKSAIDSLANVRRADVEAQLATIHKADAEQWKDITADANRAVKEADAQIARICAERGIPAALRPGLHLNWYGRGENAVKDRRAELLRAALAKIDADKKAAYHRLEAWTADTLTGLISGQLTTEAARTFLDALPTPESLLPSVQIRAELGDGQ